MPGVVFIDGSGTGTVDDWGGWPDWITECGAVVLRHSKPGSDAPGDWRTQTIPDRAEETLAAVEVLRSWPGVDPARVGVMGFSQGGWVAPVAATASADIRFVVNVSGPAVGVSSTERHRLLQAAGEGGHDVAEVGEFFDRAVEKLRRGDLTGVVELNQAAVEKPWHPILGGLYETVEIAGFLARILDFDPRPYLDEMECPILACFGAADPLVPVAESVSLLGPLIERAPTSGLFVFPGADHGIFLAGPSPDVERRSQLAPGFLPLVEGFLATL